ncbi:hypothetical protein, partial [Clostridium tarantellae]|uniref:hypothetical protein n=1 Tax=Clostridium tarantellae TaxID=39493 RepID=UPI0014796468
IIEFTFHRVILKFNHNLAIKLPLCKEGIEDNIKELELYNNCKNDLKEFLNPSLYLDKNILIVENYSKIHYLPEEIHTKIIEALKENNLQLKDNNIVDCYGKNKDKHIVLTDYTFFNS